MNPIDQKLLIVSDHIYLSQVDMSTITYIMNITHGHLEFLLNPLRWIQVSLVLSDNPSSTTPGGTPKKEKKTHTKSRSPQLRLHGQSEVVQRPRVGTV